MTPSPAALAALRAEWDHIQHFGPEMYMAATMGFVPKLLEALSGSAGVFGSETHATHFLASSAIPSPTPDVVTAGQTTRTVASGYVQAAIPSPTPEPSRSEILAAQTAFNDEIDRLVAANSGTIPGDAYTKAHRAAILAYLDKVAHPAGAAPPAPNRRLIDADSRCEAQGFDRLHHWIPYWSVCTKCGEAARVATGKGE